MTTMLKKKITLFMAAVFLITYCIGVSISAAETNYQETVIDSFPKLPDKAQLLFFGGHSDGSLDLIAKKAAMGRNSGGAITIYHWVSTDKGETWTRKSTEWGKDKKITSVYVDDQHNIWGIIETDEKYKTKEMHPVHGLTNRSYSIFKLFKVTNNSVQLVPNAKLIDNEYCEFRIIGITQDNRLIVNGLWIPFEDDEENAIVESFDSVSGKMVYKIVTDRAQSMVGGNQIFASLSKGRGVGQRHVSMYDLQAGNKLNTITYPEINPHREFPGADNSFYIFSKNGIYKLVPGAKSFTKLIDNNYTVFKELDKENRYTVACCATPDNSCYIIMQNTETKKYTLYRLS